MNGFTRRLLATTLGVLSLPVSLAEAQQRGVVLRGDGGTAGAFVSGGGVGTAAVSGRNGMQGIVVDTDGRVRRFRQDTPGGGTIGAFSGGGSSGIVTGQFDPFDFVFGGRGFPGPRFAMPVPPADVIDLDAIEAAYRRGDHALALQKAEDATRALPGDPEIQQLHALALFALGRFPDAGRAVRGVLDAGLIWDWATLRGLYDRDATYLEHYRSLRSAASEPTVSPDTLLLLAYHDLVLGRLDAATRAIQGVLERRPDDRVASDVLDALPPDPVATPK